MANGNVAPMQAHQGTSETEAVEQPEAERAYHTGEMEVENDGQINNCSNKGNDQEAPQV